jgi:head decoration protein D
VPANDSFEFDYPPGYTKPTHEFGAPYGDEFHAEAVEELLLSMAGYTQRGVTLAAGQGVLPTGCIIARHTASGKYFAYLSTATDGRQLALGVLRDGRDTGGPGAATGAIFNANTAGVNPDGITLAPTSASGGVFPASPSGKAATDALGNMVIRGILNAAVVSGTDTTSLIPNTQGLGSAAGAAVPTLGARIVAFGGGIGTPQFPGGPMDGNPSGGPTGVSAFIF